MTILFNRKTLFVLLVVGMMSFLLGGSVSAQDGDVLAFEVRWSPDGRWLGVGSDDGAWIFDANDFDAEPIRYFEDSEIFAVAFDPVRPYIAFAPQEGEQVHVLDIESGDEIFTADVPRASAENTFLTDIFIIPEDTYGASVFYDLGYSDDGTRLVLTNTSVIYVLDAETGDHQHDLYQPLERDPSSSEWITSVDFGDSAALYATDWNGRLLTFTLRDGRSSLTAVELDSEWRMEQIEVIPQSNTVLVRNNRTVFTYTADSGELAVLLGGENEPIFSLDVSADGTLLAVGGEVAWSLYDLETNETVATFESENNSDWLKRIHSLAFNPDGSQVASLQTDGQLRVWDVASGSISAELGSFARGVNQRWG